MLQDAETQTWAQNLDFPLLIYDVRFVLRHILPHSMSRWCHSSSTCSTSQYLKRKEDSLLKQFLAHRVSCVLIFGPLALSWIQQHSQGMKPWLARSGSCTYFSTRGAAWALKATLKRVGYGAITQESLALIRDNSYIWQIRHRKWGSNRKKTKATIILWWQVSMGCHLGHLFIPIQLERAPKPKMLKWLGCKHEKAKQEDIGVRKWVWPSVAPWQPGKTV